MNNSKIKIKEIKENSEISRIKEECDEYINEKVDFPILQIEKCEYEFPEEITENNIVTNRVIINIKETEETFDKKSDNKVFNDFSKTKSRKQIVKIGISQNILKCMECNKKYKCKRRFLEHYTNAHSGLVVLNKCNFCSKSYENLRNLQKHVEQNHKIYITDEIEEEIIGI